MPPLAATVVPPKPTQLPTQPLPNPNIKSQPQQQDYSADLNQNLAYSLSLSGIHL